MPLGLCDTNTLKVEDRIRVQGIGLYDDNGTHETVQMKFNKDQKWYYYPEIEKDEVLVFKTVQWDKNQKIEDM